MKTILFYVSDHGFGHATRCIALTQMLKKHFNIVIKNHNSFKFLSNSLNGCKIYDLKTDSGPIYDWNLDQLNYNQSLFSFKKFIANSPSWLNEEFDFCKKIKPDLIISDISPISLRLSKKTHIPSVSITNFSWSDILETFPVSKDRDDVLDWLDESFSYSDHALCLPLNMNLRGYRKKKHASLLTRKTTVNLNVLKKKLKIKRKLILSYSNQKLLFSKKIRTNYDLLEIRKNKIFLNNILLDEIYEGQNLTAIADCVISKIGYGMVSDCVKYKIPMLLFSRKNYPEDIVIQKKLSRLNIFLTMSDPYSKIVLEDIQKVISLKNSIDLKRLEKFEKGKNCIDFITEFL